jgi:SOS response regulatory protein OraA/RecX
MDDVRHLQAIIKQKLEELGISQTALAEKIFVADHDEDDELALARFTEALKKQLKRASTSPEKLHRYMEILLAGRRGLEARHLSVASSYLPKQVLSDMHQLSAAIDEQLRKKQLTEMPPSD